MPNLQAHVRLVSGSTSLATSRSHSVVVDRPEDKGGADLGFLGGELFLAGQGGCFLSNLAAVARARDVELRQAEVSVVGEVAEQPSRFSALRIEVSIDADAEPGQLDHLIALAARSCIVTNTVRESTTVDFKRRVVTSEGDPSMAYYGDPESD